MMIKGKIFLQACLSRWPVLLAYVLSVALVFFLSNYYGVIGLAIDFLRYSAPVLLVWQLGKLFLDYRRAANISKHRLPSQPTTALEAALMVENQRQQVREKQQLNRLRVESQDRIDNVDLFAHEIKNSLMEIHGLASQNTSVPRHKLQQPLQTADYQLNLLLNAERLAEDNNDLQFEWCDLAKLVNNVVKEMGTLFLAKQVVPEIDLGEEKVLIDPKWLRFILEQLLTNAIKYSYHGGTVTITTGSQSLQISDHGVGISQTDLPQIFAKGFTGKNGHQHKHSTGMGLYLVRRAAKMVNLTIKIDSQTGKGTTVSLSFMPEAFHSDGKQL